jgi:SAM-dependent methyltransferase
MRFVMTVFREELSTATTPAESSATTLAITLTEFDQRRYLRLINARGETIRRTTAELKSVLGIKTALDAGCGVGFFAAILQECGLTVGAFDGRMGNVVEARKRFPGIPFERGDIESGEILALGKFDLILCFGLLYHLENPMLAIRHLRALAGKGLLLESMCIPGSSAGMMWREEPAAADQSLTDIALYPSESCLVKMLYRAGFAAVYRVAELPDHDDFRETPLHARRRTVLFAATAAARLAGFERVEEPRDEVDPWSKTANGGEAASVARRISRDFCGGRGENNIFRWLRGRGAGFRRCRFRYGCPSVPAGWRRRARSTTN